MKIINIVFAADNKFIDFAGTAIVSMLSNLNTNVKCNIFIMHIENLSNSNKEKILKIENFFKCEIKFLKINPEDVEIFKNVKLYKHINLETYNRLLIPKFFSDLDKVLYLDSDIVVLDDVSEIFKIDIKQNYFAAVADANQRHKMALKIPENFIFSNCGILLININSINYDYFINKIEYSINNNSKNYPAGSDQDIINDCFYDKIYRLDYRWNFYHEWHVSKKNFYPIDISEYNKALSNPAIIHFVGEHKPWHNNYNKPYAQIFNHYYNFFINGINGNNIQKLEDMQKDIEIVNTETFAKYKGIHKGRDVVLLASGPSASKYKGIKGAIHVGVNKSFLHEVKLDYLFIQDYRAFDGYKYKILNYQGNNVEKFFGIVDNDMFKIPMHVIKSFNAKMYFTDNSKHKPSAFQKNIDKQPLGDFCSVVFSALQFILYTNPSRVYLVGCDCSNEPYFYNDSDSSDLIPDRNINNFKKLKNFIDLYYKDIDIISINPVGLKGVFKDEYAE
ncbi:glycosyltransferase family 8 protein [Campylobacter sp. Cr9]|uniref:glycosyltransferase family 8 protein n=1 Tax=Campylobacter sp. Cr9 TaxID=2735728 RepID=UPI0030146D7A|nr:glycosyltransferase family 8 protein [Campylobacter sp. Cr9]